MKYIKPNFILSALFVNCEPRELSYAIKHYEIISNLFQVGLLLQSICIMVNSDVVIVSGFRDKKHNDSIKGRKNSQHCEGKACDFYFLDKSINIVNAAQVISDTFDFDELIINEDYLHISFDKNNNRRMLYNNLIKKRHGK